MIATQLRGRVVLLVLAVAGLPVSGIAGSDDPTHREKRRTPIVDAYERARDSVVNISTTRKVKHHRLGLGMFGLPDVYSMPEERQSVGSGVVIHEDGYIATNAHVVEAADELSVIFADGSTFVAHNIGRDSASDLAVIRIDAGKPLHPILWGTSDDLMIGEQTIAIGNPVGLQNTVTTGIISALHRELNVEGRVVYRDVIQTDASINPGNSGGPLLNIHGELIGINTAIRTDAQNIGFAIPVDQLRQLLPEILETEKTSRVQVGMKVTDTLPARVIAVREGSPADAAGVQLGDIVDAVDGRKLKGPVDFYVSMLERNAGDVVSFKLVRDGKPTSAKLTLTQIPKPDGKVLAARHLGLTLADMKDKAAREFGWNRPGVIVVAVEPNSPAARQELLPGDLLVTMGRYSIIDVDHVGTLLSGISPGAVVDVGVRRITRGYLVGGEVRLYAR